jgi:hypothetical protein
VRVVYEENSAFEGYCRLERARMRNGHAEGREVMNGIVPIAARPRRIRFGAMSALLAGLAVAVMSVAAVPALAAPARLRSAASAPRAFFGVGPASKTKIDGRAYFSWSATPGATLTDHVAIVNFGATPVTLHVFVTNAVATADGGTGFLPPAKARGGPAAWVTLHFRHGSAVIHLAPRSKVIVPVSVVIPKNAPPGDHVGAIVAALTSVIRSKHHAKVHFVQQVADRIIARISGKVHPRLTIHGMRVSYRNPLNPFAAGTSAVSFTVRNSGNELLGGKVTVSVHGLLGSTESRSGVVQVPVLLPGESDAVHVTIPGVYPEFLMSARASIAPLVVTGQYDQGLTTYTGQVGFSALPRIPLAILILIAAVAALWIWRRRRRRTWAAGAKPPADNARHYTQVEA